MAILGLYPFVLVATLFTNNERIHMKLSELKQGVRVRYVPTHAHGDAKHADCETGVVSSVNATVAFVKYDNNMCIMTTGNEPYTAQAINPQDLIPAW